METYKKKEQAAQLISFLKKEYHYRPVPITLEMGDVRKLYLQWLPSWCKIEGDSNTKLYTQTGLLLCNGYHRIVIGDYGAFVEITPDQIVRSHVQVKLGQEFRMNAPQYKNCKYIWLTTKDSSNIKIYFQKHRVDYADYVPGMLYVSPYDLSITCCEERKEGKT